ncbi:MAG: hypothetical protein IT406_00810 [Candidatus Yanofskybacteria bacterium]|nr:hypothetical protein [Candidatus Yanofskybacteria bacterium]
MSSEQRTHECGELVTRVRISDAHDPFPFTQFLVRDPEDQQTYTSDYCPRCGKELTSQNTTAVKRT